MYAEFLLFVNFHLDKYKEYIEFWDDVYGFKMSTMKRDVIKEANVEVIKPEVICCEPVVVKVKNNICIYFHNFRFLTLFSVLMNVLLLLLILRKK